MNQATTPGARRSVHASLATMASASPTTITAMYGWIAAVAAHSSSQAPSRQERPWSRSAAIQMAASSVKWAQSAVCP